MRAFTLGFFACLFATAASAQQTEHRLVIDGSRPLRELRDCILAHAPGSAIVQGRGPFAVMLYGASPRRGPDQSWEVRITGDRHGSRLLTRSASRASRAALQVAVEPCLKGG